MSGLEGLAALGLACNIFQVISFGRETLGLVKSVYRDGTLDHSLMDKIAAIQGVASHIIGVTISQSGDQEKKLVDVTKNCTGVARDLQEEIAFLVSQNGQGSLRATLKIAAKANWRRRRLDRMEKALSDAEQLMQTTLLAWIFKSVNATIINISSLEKDVQNFVIKYEQGCRQASQLVSSEALRVREVVMQQTGKTEKNLRDHVTQTSAKLEQKFEYQIEQASRDHLRVGLLKSLKYPGMNERANQVEDAHARTFGWLFADADASSYGDDEGSCSSRSEELGNQESCCSSSEKADSPRAPINTRDLDSIFEGLDASSYVDTAMRFLTSMWADLGDFQDDWSDIDTDDEHEEEPPEMVWSSFTDWLQSDLSIYWIMGKPGSGKSTLAKFILSDLRTRTTLEKWRHDVIIVSHYFWRPGSLLQRSIKGMLCSIIYQLVFCEPLALDYALLNVPRLGQKDDHTDWSVLDLQRLCLGLISHCDKPLCLFVDGLDECGPEDDHQKLLDLLERIRLPNVKIVVSSRNEPIFEERFRHEPQLRVQDLTAGDLRIYAMDMLHQKIKDDLCQGLVEKAEGVFLWLVLAVQSINRGWSNRESLPELQERITNLPKGLNDWYKDMWERVDDDRNLYRKSAALYFKLAIAAHDGRLNCLKHWLSPLEMMLASSPKAHHGHAKGPVISESQLVQDCEDFQNRVRVRCAGLLVLDEVSGRPLTWDREGIETTTRAFLQCSDGLVVRFIHRSVHDFLVDTVEGQKILSYDGTPIEEINTFIISAHLRAVELYELLHPGTGILCREDIGRPYLEDYLEDLSSIAHAREGAARELVSHCYELYNSSLLNSQIKDVKPARIAAFFGAAANFPNLNPCSTSIIEKQLVGRGIKSAVLLAMVSNRLKPFPLRLIRWLLKLPEVDVNLKGPLLLLLDPTDDYQSEGVSPLDHIMESPFERLLRTGLELLDWEMAETTRQRHQFLGLVADFVSRGADLRSTLILAIPLDHAARDISDRPEVIPKFFHFPGDEATEWISYNAVGDDSILCVVALQAATVIQWILASLPTTNMGHRSMNEYEYSPNEDGYSSSDLESALSFLSQSCQEHGSGADDGVIGFTQHDGNFSGMPYRQVSKHDSANLMKLIKLYILEDDLAECDLEAHCREVRARSPFSSIGFKDYLEEMGCFDEVASRKLHEEYASDFAFR